VYSIVLIWYLSCDGE